MLHGVRPINEEFNMFNMAYELDYKPSTVVTIVDGVAIDRSNATMEISAILSSDVNTIVSSQGTIAAIESIVEDITESGREVKIQKVAVRDNDYNEVSIGRKHD